MLAAYLERGRFAPLHVPFDRGAVESGFKSRPLPAAEVDLALGNLLVAANRATEAEPYLARAATALPDDPRGPEALGLMSHVRQQHEDAGRHFTEAYRRGSRSYFGHFLRGQRELQAVLLSSVGAADPTAAVDSLLRCLQINPRFLPAAESLANLLTMLPERSPQAEATVRVASVRHPANARILAGLALLEAKHGTVENARQALERAKALPARGDPMPARILNAAELLLSTRERLGAGQAP